MRSILRDFLFIGFFIFIVGVIITANRGALGGTFALAHRLPYFDKVGLFVLMGLLAFFAIISIVPRMAGSRKSATVKVISIFLLLMALEEGSQSFIPSRTFSLMDFFAGLAGVLCAAWLAPLLLKPNES